MRVNIHLQVKKDGRNECCEVAQWVRVLDTKSDNLCLILELNIWWKGRTSSCKLSCNFHTWTHKHGTTHTHTKFLKNEVCDSQ